ncbi:hypothetical protein V5O48_010570 [Marasmius crinis-equi]|uniref:Uncharacterized protein n=1 Tax=Marasmius crinis-equi TaxID=585013 RepID=A0ABR3F817_9AGAR
MPGSSSSSALPTTSSSTAPVISLPQNDFGETSWLPSFDLLGPSSWFSTGDDEDDQCDNLSKEEEVDELVDEMEVDGDVGTSSTRKRTRYKENPFLQFKEEAPQLLLEMM